MYIGFGTYPIKIPGPAVSYSYIGILATTEAIFANRGRDENIISLLEFPHLLHSIGAQ